MTMQFTPSSRLRSATRHFGVLSAVLSLFCASALRAQTEAATETQGQAGAVDVTVLDEGPIHEAFAEPVTNDVDNGLVVDREPPQPVEEIPPDHRPEGTNVQWIPGYWFWLEDKNDFVWISGVWRAVPPGREWTPGYWSNEAEGYRWIRGFWSDAESTQVEYLPLPPESLENGPTSPPPRDNHFWIPGCYKWTSNRYAWRPGYWYPGQANWMWIPHHYVYTTRGAVFVPGYWDYPLQRRGLLYAPVYWGGGYRAGYRFVPNQLVNTALLLTSLFIDSNRGYYYYGPRYGGIGRFSPWYAGYGTGIYSPLFGFYSWQYGQDSNQWRGRFDRAQRRQQNRQQNRAVQQTEDRLVGNLDSIRRSLQQEGGVASSAAGSPTLQMTRADQQAVQERIGNLRRFEQARASFEAKGENVARVRGRNARPGEQPARGDTRVATPSEQQQPQVLDLQTVDAAQQLRRQARERNRHEVLRPNVQSPGERSQRAEAQKQGQQRVNRARPDRGNRQAVPQRRGPASDIRPNRQTPAAPRPRQANRRAEAPQQRANARAAENSARARRPNVEAKKGKPKE